MVRLGMLVRVGLLRPPQRLRGVRQLLSDAAHLSQICFLQLPFQLWLCFVPDLRMQRQDLQSTVYAQHEQPRSSFGEEVLPIVPVQVELLE